MPGGKDSRLARLMKRAAEGGEFTLGFLGGSITQGSLSSSPKRCYAYLVYQWWCEAFPNARFHYVNAGIGGTDSYFGVSRIHEDLLMYRPDFVMVDFSVNDKPLPLSRETFEGVIRRLLAAPSHPAILMLNNVYYDTGVSAQAEHTEIADHYQIPSVSAKDTIYRRIQAGEYERHEITPDGLHPNDYGHQLLAEEVLKYLRQVKASTDEYQQEGGGHQIPAPVTANRYENARRLTIANFAPELDGFRADSEEKKGHLDFFKNGWFAASPGDRLSAVVDAACIAVQYRRTARTPSPSARLTLDGQRSFLLDGCFDEDWGDCLFLQSILSDHTAKRHRIEIEIVKTYGSEQAPFYLLSFIVA